MKKVFLILVVTICSCSVNSTQIIGKYSLNGKNTTDSLFIYKDNKYIHEIFQRNNGTLLNKSEGNWSYSDGRIQLYYFYNNENNKLNYVLKEDDIKDLKMNCSFPVYKEDEKMKIEVNADEDLYYIK